MARADPSAAWPRTQSSAAVSIDGRRWFLLNASPDVREQLRWLRGDDPDQVMRHVPFEGVILTDAEIDHSLGLVLLREAGLIPVVATPAVEAILEHDSRLLLTVRAFSQVVMTPLSLEVAVGLSYRDGTPSGLLVEAFAVKADPPRFATREDRGHTVGLMLRDEVVGTSCAFVPGCGGLDTALLQRLAGATAILFDGTFWSDEELVALGIGSRTARQLDHLPIGGPDGSLAALGTLPVRHRVYTHINNTNPILMEHSAERARVTATGMMVGFDGLRLTLEAP